MSKESYKPSEEEMKKAYEESLSVRTEKISTRIEVSIGKIMTVLDMLEENVRVCEQIERDESVVSNRFALKKQKIKEEILILEESLDRLIKIRD